MILQYRNPQFWRDFHSNHWKPRVPTVLRQPFKQFPFSEDLLLRAMRGFETGLCNGDHRKHCLVSVGDAEKSPRRPLRRLFREKNDTLEDLEKACARIFPKMNFGLMVTNMHAVDPGIWSAVTAFLQDGHPWIDFPVPRAFMDLFYGRYSSSFTGLHKDTQEIFAFVVRGEKRILAWPFNYFLSKVKGLTPGDRYFNKRLSIDYRKYRKDALVLDASPGDVIYWPSEYWHVAETRSTKFSAMLSLGILRTEIKLAETSSSPFREKLLGGNSSSIPSQEMVGVGQPDAGRLRWVTGFGFEIGGPTAEVADSEPTDTLTVVKNPGSIILWQRDRSKRQLVVASGGHSITVPDSAQLVRLLEQISEQQPVTVSKTYRRASHHPPKILETYWNHQCEFKVRKLSSQRDLRAWLVHWLLRVYAVRGQPDHST